jgi:DNA invertase Pin-like site-specific DNA recombinase
VFREKITGTTAARPQLAKLMKALAPGDVVITPAVDRLSRDTTDLLVIARDMHRAEAGIRSLAEPWADTGTSTGRLMIAVLGGLADVERDLIRTRTAEGRSRAKARGQPMGRPPALTPEQRKEAIRRRARAGLRCKNWRTAISRYIDHSARDEGRMSEGQPHID